MSTVNRAFKSSNWGMTPAHFIILALSMLFVFGTALPAFAQDKESAPRIQVSDDYFYFGYMPRGAIVAHTYWISNVGTDTLEIVKVKPGCGCTTVPLKQDKVAPGDSVGLTMSFDTELMSGKVVKGIDIFTNDPSQEITSVKFFAVVNARYPHVGIEPATLRFAKFGSEDDRILKELKIVNNFEDKIEISMIEFPEKFFTIDQRTVEIEEGQEIVLTIEQVEVPTDKADILTSLTLEVEGPETERVTVPMVCYFKRGK